MRDVQRIYLAPVTHTNYNSENGYTEVTIIFNNKEYTGIAILAPEDKDFYSQKVGYNIALSKARIKAIKELWYQQKKRAFDAWTYYYRTSSSTSSNLYHKALSAIQKAEEYLVCLEDEKQVLTDYLKGQERAMQSVKRFRNQDNNN